MQATRATVHSGAAAAGSGGSALLAARPGERILPMAPRRRRRRSGRSLAALALVLLAALVLVALVSLPADLGGLNPPNLDWLRAEQPRQVWDLSASAPAAPEAAAMPEAPPAPPPATTEAAAFEAAAPPPAPALPREPGDAGIREIERLLQRLSFTPGPVDGTLDPATQEAIREYEATAGLPVTGLPSESLLDELRAVSDGFAQGAP